MVRDYYIASYYMKSVNKQAALSFQGYKSHISLCSFLAVCGLNSFWETTQFAFFQGEN